jgi:TfoX N-terminal domain
MRSQPEKVHFEKSPAELADRFATVLDRFPSAERRKMFGYPAAFLGGNMVTGLHGQNWVIRLSDADREELLGLDGARQFEPMPGRPMKGFAVVPASIVGDDREIDTWLERAFAHVRTMPPKK